MPQITTNGIVFTERGTEIYSWVLRWSTCLTKEYGRDWVPNLSASQILLRMTGIECPFFSHVEFKICAPGLTQNKDSEYTLQSYMLRHEYTLQSYTVKQRYTFTTMYKTSIKVNASEKVFLHKVTFSGF